mmetsp:Transcript_6940/g.19334  ORF Transcript_6940/g.19334 Transcript_6940/m.19334 type:complete len:144 (-) Transcript_6940:16-447(-)
MPANCTSKGSAGKWPCVHAPRHAERIWTAYPSAPMQHRRAPHATWGRGQAVHLGRTRSALLARVRIRAHLGVAVIGHSLRSKTSLRHQFTHAVLGRSSIASAENNRLRGEEAPLEVMEATASMAAVAESSPPDAVEASSELAE